MVQPESYRMLERKSRTIGSSAAVAEHDVNELSPIPQGVHALTAGNLVCILEDEVDGAGTTFPVIAGVYYPYRVKIFKTASTATIRAMY